MGLRIGPFDPIQLTFNVMNALIKKGLITIEEAKEIIRESLPQTMNEKEKTELINSLIVEDKKKNTEKKK